MKYLLMTVLLVALAAAVGAHSRFTDAPAPGVAAELTMQSIGELPSWARSVLTEVVDARYQVQAAVVDLNGDTEPEIVLAAAPPRYDVHVPDRPVEVLVRRDGEWSRMRSDTVCQPYRLGAFRHDGWRDLRCRTGGRDQVLSLRDGQYRLM